MKCLIFFHRTSVSGSYNRLSLGNSNGKWIGKGKKMPKGWWSEGLGRHCTYRNVKDHWNTRNVYGESNWFLGITIHRKWWKLLLKAFLGGVKTTPNGLLKLTTFTLVCYGLFYLMISLCFCECMKCCTPQVQMCLV